MKLIAAPVAVLLFIPLPVASHDIGIDLEIALKKARLYTAKSNLINAKTRMATYFTKLFNHDWHLNREREPSPVLNYEHLKLLAVVLVWTAAAMVLIRHWRQ